MEVDLMRDEVKRLYPNQTWSSQVDKMTNEQVIAIYIKNLVNPPPLQPKELPPTQGQLF